MAYSFHIDQAARANAVRGIGLETVERKGSRADFVLFHEDRWLQDTAVIEHLTRIRGEWRVELVFASVHNPLQLIKRYITAHPTHQRAAVQAHYMRRLAAKDQRGTLTVSIEPLKLCPN